MNYSVLTPALVPDAARSWKKANVGDQLILDSIEELVGAHHSPSVRLSSWQKLSGADIERINETRALILAGANPLQDEYRIAPEFTIEDLHRIRVPIIPVGVGLYGDRAKEVRMSASTATMLRGIHERIEFSSWRCPRTIDYLVRNLPELRGKMLMTGCPVVQSGRSTRPQNPVDANAGSVAVTVTERGLGWWARELRILESVRRAFPGRMTTLVLHQQFKSTNSKAVLRSLLPSRYGQPADFHALARRRGFEVVCPATTAEMRAFYSGSSVHVGSRLHAHLHFLSQNKSSYLFAVDGRAQGFADSLAFPLLDGSEAILEGRCDFAAVQSEIAKLWHTPMRRFSDSLQQVLA